VTSLVLSHLVNGVVDSVEIELFSTLSDAELVLSSTSLSQHSLLYVGLRVPNNPAKEFSELSAMVSLLKRIATESLCDLGIALAIGLTAHCQIHTYLGSLTHEVSVEVSTHLLVGVLSYTDNVLANESNTCCFVYNFPSKTCLLALGANSGSFSTFMNVATNRANKFLSHND